MAKSKQDKIDKVQFEKLCALHCTREEIASFFDCSEDTIDRWCKNTYGETFAIVYRQKRSAGRVSLRRTQFRMAETNPTMAIWLGKQWLGQAERQEIAVIQDDDTIKEMEQWFKEKKEQRKQESDEQG